MWSTVITGLFALAGVAFGVLLEPVKTLIGARAKTRQVRGEQCAKLIRAVTVFRQGAVSLNADLRARTAKQRTAEPEQVRGWIAQLNEAKEHLRETSALLYLYGPDNLAAEAVKVRDAEDEMYRLMTTPGDGVFTHLAVPVELDDAARALDDATRQFARTARQYTR